MKDADVTSITVRLASEDGRIRIVVEVGDGAPINTASVDGAHESTDYAFQGVTTLSEIFPGPRLNKHGRGLQVARLATLIAALAIRHRDQRSLDAVDIPKLRSWEKVGKTRTGTIDDAVSSAVAKIVGADSPQAIVQRVGRNRGNVPLAYRLRPGLQVAVPQQGANDESLLWSADHARSDEAAPAGASALSLQETETEAEASGGPEHASPIAGDGEKFDVESNPVGQTVHADNVPGSADGNAIIDDVVLPPGEPVGSPATPKHFAWMSKLRWGVGIVLVASVGILAGFSGLVGSPMIGSVATASGTTAPPPPPNQFREQWYEYITAGSTEFDTPTPPPRISLAFDMIGNLHHVTWRGQKVRLSEADWLFVDLESGNGIRRTQVLNVQPARFAAYTQNLVVGTGDDERVFWTRGDPAGVTEAVRSFEFVPLQGTGDRLIGTKFEQQFYYGSTQGRQDWQLVSVGTLLSDDSWTADWYRRDWRGWSRSKERGAQPASPATRKFEFDFPVVVISRPAASVSIQFPGAPRLNCEFDLDVSTRRASGWCERERAQYDFIIDNLDAPKHIQGEFTREGQGEPMLFWLEYGEARDPQWQ